MRWDDEEEEDGGWNVMLLLLVRGRVRGITVTNAGMDSINCLFVSLIIGLVSECVCVLISVLLSMASQPSRQGYLQTSASGRSAGVDIMKCIFFCIWYAPENCFAFTWLEMDGTGEVGPNEWVSEAGLFCFEKKRFYISSFLMFYFVFIFFWKTTTTTPRRTPTNQCVLFLGWCPCVMGFKVVVPRTNYEIIVLNLRQRFVLSRLLFWGG